MFTNTDEVSHKRLRIIISLIPLFTLVILIRLFYWQIVRGPELKAKAQLQHQSTTSVQARRGQIVDREGNILAGTKSVYHLYLYKPQLEISNPELIEALFPILSQDTDASGAAQLRDYLNERISLSSNWISIKHYLPSEIKEMIEAKEITGLGFEDEYIRFYPESSMSAHVLGFVGQNMAGEEQGYFGLEGFFDRQLKGRGGKVRTEIDAKGNPILIGDYNLLKAISGKDIKTTIDKKIQYFSEKLLKEGLEKYEAVAGNIIVMESKTGKIRAMASYPNYAPEAFSKFDSSLYKNPNVANLFEPGSIFKPLVIAAALNEKEITPETKCDICDRPVVIGKYAIRTWNEEYHKDSTITDVIINSDNTGMVFAARKLGADRFVEYLKRYGFGEKTEIELQDEVTGVLNLAKTKSEIDLATNSFGQGIAVTPIQMVSAINTIANKGVYVRPSMIEDSLTETRQVLSQEASHDMTKIMIQAVDKGESKWAKPQNMQIAGKTGTAQIPIEGHYDAEKTIASFVGFFPAQDSKYTILVSLREPKTSQWGSETAAPLWFKLAKQLLL